MGTALLTIPEGPFKVTNLIRWYLNRYKYSHHCYEELLSLWYFTHKDGGKFKTDNPMQEVTDHIVSNKHMLVKRVFPKEGQLNVGQNLKGIKEFKT